MNDGTFMGEPVLTRWAPLGRDESQLRLHQSMWEREYGNPSDDKLMLGWLWEHGYALCERRPDVAAFRRADSVTPPAPESNSAAPSVVEPVAWAGYNLDDMAEAFFRVIEAHHSKTNPFHNPINADAQIALRTLRGFIPAMNAHAAHPPQAPLTNAELRALGLEHSSASVGAACEEDEAADRTGWFGFDDVDLVAFARAVLAAAHPPRALVPLTEQQISKAARALSDRTAAAFNLDAEDEWKTYSDCHIDDARAALEAAHKITAASGAAK